MKELNALKESYENIEIPDSLENEIRMMIKKGRKKSGNTRHIIQWSSGLAAALAFIITLNISPTFSNAMSEIPIVGQLVKVLIIKEYQINEDTYNVDIKIPAIEGLENKGLQSYLNDKYLEENQTLYENFVKDMDELEKAGGGHMGVNSGYIIKTDNEIILSIGNYVVNTVGSSSTTFKYDTVDKEQGIMITLPSLFLNDTYVNIINGNIREQMKQRMQADKNLIYWINDEDIEPFSSIRPDQNFYINDSNKLVISFDKYEVAPGYMGIIEFEIPTEILQEILVSNRYIK